MSTKYFALLTHIGAARLANATMLGGHLNITQMAVGDGGGTLPTPDPAQTELIGEKRRAPLNSLTIDANNSNQIIAEQVIQENEGGFWIREIGLYDADDNLIAIANCPETYKPQLQEGSGRIQTVRMILIVSNTEAVTLKIDPAVVLATRQYVDERVVEVKAYADSQLTAHVTAANPHKQYAPINSPALTGTPTAPTPTHEDNSTRIATTEFVKSVLSSLTGGTPAEMGTLTALASALGNDPHFSDTLAAALKLKLDITELVGIPLPWPQVTAPTGWLKCNGQTFNTALYPMLAMTYPSGTLPDLRGEFIRGWDDGRSAGRTIGSQQSATAIRTGVMDYNGTDIDSSSVYIGIAHADPDSSVNTINYANQRFPNGVLMSTNSLSVDNGVTGNASNLVFKNGVNWFTVRPRNLAFNYIVRAA
ncbi:phage tail protein [Pectobacteriaceae bacterium CE90]|nr:phage tail protein [Pectobacteriaceae bacterium CE90]WJY16017.1 phage tail protein [Pectobacteriaceae bacterium CE90]